MSSPPAPELLHVLKGLALNREPGWNFPGNFLEISFDEMAHAHARLSVDCGPHCVDADGRMNLGALSILADIGLAAGMRQQVGMASRMATVAMTVKFTGAPAVGRVESDGEFDGFLEGTVGRQGLSRARITSGGVLVAAATGTFMALGNSDGKAPLPARRRGETPPPAALTPQELTGEERVVYDRAVAALEKRAPGESFIDRFWGFEARAAGAGATCDFPNGLHVGNRVGHTQGGLTFALAGKTAIAALGPDWMLAGISAWYVSPGTGPMLRAESSILHQGSLTAVVRTRITGESDRLVLEAVTNHSKKA